MTNRYPRETVEFQAVTVTVDGATVTSNVEFCVINRTARPTTWAAATTLEGRIGIMVEDYEPGIYAVWARITDSPEIPVLKCGEFTVT